MKARIPPQKRLSRETLKACVEYANSLQDANNVRIFKLSCRVLHEYFGFGAQRLTKYVNMLDEMVRQNTDNEVFWEQTDREMKQLGLNFADEKYEDIIGEWKKQVGDDVKIGDKIEIALGSRTLAVEVLAVAEAVRKDDAATMYKEV